MEKSESETAQANENKIDLPGLSVVRSFADDEEEEMLLVLDLVDLKDHSILDLHNTCTLEGIDTLAPKLRIGDFLLHGTIEETIGTTIIYDTGTARSDDKKDPYRYVGKSNVNIKFTIAAPENL
uniref:AlNc14C71G4898 protein n=1 Tax=Albugo laibachii Nc14 TaxID=890382 RepID=F0WE37_9STRA|nr:AlNc14C71G4898 [Albugo laibachii Nc14]|eukprot:CCA19466.1 AlNc14C71G4898 [Albugo laibachii Nc14]